MLSTAQISRMRTTVSRSFVDTIVIKARAASADAEGNPSGALTTVDTIAGRLARPTPAELQIAAQAGQRLDGVLTVAQDAPIEPGNVIEVNADTTWKVVAVSAGRVQAKVNLARWEG